MNTRNASWTGVMPAGGRAANFLQRDAVLDRTSPRSPEQGYVVFDRTLVSIRTRSLISVLNSL